MSCCSPSSCGTGCAGCKAMKMVGALLLALATIASAIGVWKNHMMDGALSFGSLEGSLSLLVFVFALVLTLKMVKGLCPCAKGVCPGCGKDPCVCAH